jgi:hypothetical protein
VGAEPAAREPEPQAVPPERGFYGDRYSDADGSSTDRGYSRYGTSDELPAPSTRNDRYSDSVDARSADAADLADGSATESTELNDPDLSETARQIKDGLRSDYQRTTEELQSRIREGYSRFSSDADQVADPAAADAESELQPPTGPPIEQTGAIPGDDLRPEETAVTPTPRPRSTQPWRPGGTSTYPEAQADQTHNPAPSRYGDVEPASYPSRVSSEHRLAPSYR